MSKPVVAIVGRPNVGKSTLFNRLAEERLAIVEDVPGTTRDRLYVDVAWAGREFALVDTGGLLLGPTTELEGQIREQVETAIEEADLVLFLVDAGDGVTVGDADIAELLRRSGRPLLLVVNKADNRRRAAEAAHQFYELGLGEPMPISAYHGFGIADLLDAAVEVLPPTIEETPSPALKVAIVGRPNVGKSQLLNAILGRERVIVSSTPGTTRDAIDTVVETDDGRLLFIDTAGIRRRGRVAPGVERYSVGRALRAIARADVVLLVIDAIEGITEQDVHVAGYAFEAVKGLALVVNKWDLVADRRRAVADFDAKAAEHLKFFPDVPVLFVSALTSEGVEGIIPIVRAIGVARQRQIAAETLSVFLREAVAAHPPPSSGTRRLAVRSIVQVGVNPPSFVVRVNEPELLHFSYRRYLTNRLRAAFDFAGTPLKLVFTGPTRQRPTKARSA